MATPPIPTSYWLVTAASTTSSVLIEYYSATGLTTGVATLPVDSVVRPVGVAPFPVMPAGSVGAKILSITGASVYFSNSFGTTNISSEILAVGQLLGDVAGQPGVLQGYPGVAIADPINPRQMAGVDDFGRLRITVQPKNNVLYSRDFVPADLTGNSIEFKLPDFPVVITAFSLQAKLIGGTGLTGTNNIAIELSRNLDGNVDYFDSVTTSGSVTPIVNFNQNSMSNSIQIYDTIQRPSKKLKIRFYSVATSFPAFTRIEIRIYSVGN